MFKCQDRESEGSEVAVKKRREGEEREEKVNQKIFVFEVSKCRHLIDLVQGELRTQKRR